MKSDPVPAAHQAPSDYKILGLGTIVVDHVAEVRSLPEPDTKTDILSSHYQVGGPVVTALALLSKWGYPTSFIGCWSKDELGERIEQDLMKSQIQNGFASVHPSHHSGHAHVWVEASTGRRSIAAFRGRGSLDWTELEHLSWSEWKALHLDGSHGEVATLAAREMKKHGGIVTMDLGSPNPNLPKLLEHVDALQCPAGLLTQLYPDQSDIEAARCLLDLGPREITVTMGSEGALWLNRNEQRYQKALPIEAVDTNGAGDVFAGASMHARYQGWPPEHRLKFASACSALKCQQWGNREALPKMEPILSLMG